MIVNKDGTQRTLKRTGPVLGVIPDAEHLIAEVRLDPGDLLFAYTDGLTEPENPAGEVLCVEELVPLLTQPQSLSTQLEQVLTRAEAHAEGAKRFDDITLLALRRVQDCD